MGLAASRVGSSWIASHDAKITTNRAVRDTASARTALNEYDVRRPSADFAPMIPPGCPPTSRRIFISRLAQFYS